MASKTIITRGGNVRINGSIELHPGMGRTQCPKCNQATPSRKLSCNHCGHTRTPVSKMDHYHLGNKAEVARLRLELDRAHIALAKKDKEIAKLTKIKAVPKAVQNWFAKAPKA